MKHRAPNAWSTAENERPAAVSEKSNGGPNPGKPKAAPKRRVPLVAALIADVFIAAIILLVFSLFYFILPRELSGQTEILPTGTSQSLSPTTATSVTIATSEPTQAATESITETTTATTANPITGLWADKFATWFTAGPVEQTATSYRSSHVNVNIEKIQKSGVTYYLADIYVADPKYFRSALAKDKYGKGFHDTTDEIARQNNAILAINGDYYSNNAGPVVRNGVLYRDELYKDVMVMWNDGRMETFTATELDMDKVRTEGAYQIWTFGPMLLDDGQPMEKFNSSVYPANPRTAIGYYEPGHYCFVLVDGRQPGYSSGYNLKQMSQLFFDLGCTVAYNLDGGQSSEMAFMGELTNQPYHGGRETSDIVMIIDEG